jgi:hypothetical protein
MEASAYRSHSVGEGHPVESQYPGAAPERGGRQRMAAEIGNYHRVARQSITGAKEMDDGLGAEMVRHLTHQYYIHTLVSNWRGAGTTDHCGETALPCERRRGPVQLQADRMNSNALPPAPTSGDTG